MCGSAKHHQKWGVLVCALKPLSWAPGRRLISSLGLSKLLAAALACSCLLLLSPHPVYF